MRAEVLSTTFGARRRGYVGWIVGILLLTAFTFAFYPSIRGSGEFDRVMEQLPDALQSFVGEKDITSPEGYLESQLFLYVLPILFFVYAIGQGADAIAGEESRKTLDLLLAHPIPRGRVVLEKFASTLVGLFGLGSVLLLTVLVGAVAVDMDLSLVGLSAVTLGCILLSAQMGALSLAVGAATGKKSLAVAVASTAATASYFVHSLAPQIEALEPAQRASPFYYYLGGDPIVNGFQWLDLSVLAGLTAILVWAGRTAFCRRDIGI